MDAARTAIRKGSREVVVYVRTDSPTASNEEVEYAKIDGVQFVFNKAPIRITDEGVVLVDTKVEENGDITLIEDSAKLEKADTILVAISQVPQTRLVSRDPDLKLNDRGNLKIDEIGATTMPGVFASGDVVTGAKTVVHAVALSRQIAEEMDRYMKGPNGHAAQDAASSDETAA